MFIGVIIVAIIALVALIAVVFISEQMEIQRIQEMENAVLMKEEECFQLIGNQRFLDMDFTHIDKCNVELAKMSKEVRFAKYELADYTQQQINQAERQIEQNYEDSITNMYWENFVLEVQMVCGFNDFEKCGTTIHDNSEMIQKKWLSCYDSRSYDGDFSVNDEDVCVETTLSIVGIVIDEWGNIVNNYNMGSSGFNP